MSGQAQSVRLNGVDYTLALDEGNAPGAQRREPYKESEVPTHYDLDIRMERRVVYNYFGNILKKRDEKAQDAASQSPYARQTRAGDGVYWALGGDARMPDRIMAQRQVLTSIAVASTPVAIGDASTYSYFACKQHVYSLSSIISGVQQLILSKDFSAINPAVNIVDAIQYNGKLYIASVQLTNGSPDYAKGQVMWIWDQATTTTNWTQPTASPGYASGDTGKATAFTSIRNQLWRANGPNMWAWDGVAANWSSAYVIGDPTTNITALDVYRDALWIFKPEGIFTVDRSGQVYPLFPGLRTLGFNVRPIGQWRSEYYFASDVGMVWQVTGANIRSIGFDQAEPYPMGSGTYGLPNVATKGLPLPNALVVGFNQFNNNGTQAYYLAWDGKQWMPYQYFTSGKAACIGLTGGNQTPVSASAQFGLSGANGVFYMLNPTLDPYLSTAFDTTAQVMYLPVDSGAIEDEDKVVERVNIVVDNSTKGTVNLAYALDDDIPSLVWHDLGNPVGKGTGFQQWDFPLPFPKYKKIALRVTFTVTTSAASPIIRNIVLHYKQRGPQRRAWEVQLVAQDKAVGLGGRLDIRRTKQIKDDLDGIRQNRQQVEFIDIMNTTRQVYVDEVAAILATLKPPNDPVLVVTLKLVEAAQT